MMPRCPASLLLRLISRVRLAAATRPIGNGQSKLDAVREAVQQNFDAAPWRERFAGADQASRDAFDAAYVGLITAAHAETWVR